MPFLALHVPFSSCRCSCRSGQDCWLATAVWAPLYELDTTHPLKGRCVRHFWQHVRANLNRVLGCWVLKAGGAYLRLTPESAPGSCTLTARCEHGKPATDTSSPASTLPCPQTALLPEASRTACILLSSCSLSHSRSMPRTCAEPTRATTRCGACGHSHPGVRPTSRSAWTPAWLTTVASPSARQQRLPCHVLRVLLGRPAGSAHLEGLIGALSRAQPAGARRPAVWHEIAPQVVPVLALIIHQRGAGGTTCRLQRASGRAAMSFNVSRPQHSSGQGCHQA